MFSRGIDPRDRPVAMAVAVFLGLSAAGERRTGAQRGRRDRSARSREQSAPIEPRLVVTHSSSSHHRTCRG